MVRGADPGKDRGTCADRDESEDNETQTGHRVASGRGEFNVSPHRLDTVCACGSAMMSPTHRASMRALVVLVVLLGAPTALADDACEPQTTRIEPVEGAHVYVAVEQRECPEGRSLDAAILDPDGRTELTWYDDERGSGIAVIRSPRLVSWTEDERGCTMVVYTFGPTELECAAGAPPPPP
jgi:hypothetical protein